MKSVSILAFVLLLIGCFDQGTVGAPVEKRRTHCRQVTTSSSSSLCTRSTTLSPKFSKNRYSVTGLPFQYSGSFGHGM
ncbi:hypothetical protein PCANC_20616 [Puccinia coronata f. sp. avenae]|uniref:Uncharacterized protein n=1 Tax=Puccinia coronata f. sp. avenae TaxID=200324 RepID=A0A2N5SIW9_9BASI|nr:hypothetical protein PCANC_20616 [Puccinia coronata f. sp. avenae]